MDLDDLVLLSDLNYDESNRESARRSGGTVLDEDGLLLYANAHALPVIINGVTRTGRPGDALVNPEEVLGRARAFFGARERGFSVSVRAHADTDLERVVADAGLAPFGDAPAMVLEHRLEDRPLPPGIDMRRVTDAAAAADFATVNTAAYATYGMPPHVAPVVFARVESLVAPHITAFVAYESDRPVAAAMTLVSHGVAGVYWVGTIPDARGRGLAEAVTRTATNAGLDLGGRIASLQASPMGEPVYARMGYREVTRYRTWVQLEHPAP